MNGYVWMRPWVTTGGHCPSRRVPSLESHTPAKRSSRALRASYVSAGRPVNAQRTVRALEAVFFCPPDICENLDKRGVLRRAEVCAPFVQGRGGGELGTTTQLAAASARQCSAAGRAH